MKKHSFRVRFGLTAALGVVLAGIVQAEDPPPNPGAPGPWDHFAPWRMGGPGKPVFEDGAAKLVRAALEKELAGQNAERETLLREALKSSPDNPAAHWQLGEVSMGPKRGWLPVAEAEKAAAKDRRLAEYRRRRDAVGRSLDGQVFLARWCARNQLPGEEQAHWYSVVQMQPNHPEAMRRLDLHPYRGQMLTSAQIAALNQQSHVPTEAFSRLVTSLYRWQQAIDRGETAPTAELREAIAKLSAPVDLEAIGQMMAPPGPIVGDATRKRVIALAEALHDNPHPAAAECLARAAVGAKDADDVRAACVAGLKEHPVDHYVPMLLESLRAPIEVDIRFNVDAAGDLITNTTIYQEGALADGLISRADIPVRPSPQELNLNPNATLRRNGPEAQRMWREETARQSRGQQSHQRAVQQQSAFYDNVERANRGIAENNAPIVAVLEQTTGQNFGEHPGDWWYWWMKDHNDSYNPFESPDVPKVANPYRPDSPKPVIRYDLVAAQQLPSLDRPPECFAAGTEVWTQTGRIAIEKMKVGDCVLSQDVESGELCYKPVLRVTVRPPHERIKATFASDSLVATPGHPIWINGKGWRLFRELEVGQLLHSLSGGVPIARIDRPEIRSNTDPNSYNLVVADFSTYFVTESGILVHDNTARRPTSARVPGLPVQ
jgi:hypothetical protein